MYNPMLLATAERIKQPVTVGEHLAQGGNPMMNAFSKHVMVITGGILAFFHYSPFPQPPQAAKY